MKTAAETLGIPVLQPPNLRGEAIRAELAALAPDVIVVAAYGRFLPAAVLELPPHGCLNLHPSLLPRHRGPSPVAATILAGDDTAGVTLMLLDEGMDTGPVIASAAMPLAGGETSGELTATLFGMGGALLRDNLEPWVNGQLRAKPQDEALATVTRKLERDDGLIDWAEPADLIARKGRAFDPWPGLHTVWQGRTLKILRCEPLPNCPAEANLPGQVVAEGKGIAVVTGRGMLALSLVQLEGGRPVNGSDFVNGHPSVTGAALG